MLFNQSTEFKFHVLNFLSKESDTIFSFDILSILQASFVWPLNVLIHSQVFKSNNFNILSCEHVTNLSFDIVRISITGKAWLLIVNKRSPVSVSHFYWTYPTTTYYFIIRYLFERPNIRRMNKRFDAFTWNQFP